MQYNDPMLGVAFVGSILMLAIFATLFQEKEKPSPGGRGQGESENTADDQQSQ